MIADSHERAEFQGTRWKTVRFGLRLANNWLGVRAITCFYALWCLIGLVLCVVIVPFVVLGKLSTFRETLNPIALYGFVLPIGLMAASTWVVKLLSRLFWCAIPEPPTATFLAFASTAGRLSLIIAAVGIWHWGGPFGKGLLLPQTVACAGVAWLGLVADWGFIRTLRPFIPTADPAASSPNFSDVAEDSTEERAPEQTRKGVFTRDLDPEAWFKRRFPKAYRFVSWVLLPLAYVALSSLADNGDPQAIPDAILRFAVIAPALVQVFWIPGDELCQLINALSPRTVPENLHPR
jgi:hypothetical protein